MFGSRFCKWTMAFLSFGISCGQEFEKDLERKDRGDSLAQAVDQFKKFDLDEIEKTVKAFLTSETVTERLKYVRDAKRVYPLMTKFYGGEKIEAEGFEELDRSEVTYLDQFLTTTVMTGDFVSSPIALEREEGKESSYRVDWESWVGYCESSVEELKNEKPTEPVLVRALVSSDSYFNYFFGDDKTWSSYKLAFRNVDATFSAYAQKGSKIDQRLSGMVKEGDEIPMILKIAYPPKAKGKTQVEIMEIVEQGWILEVAEEKKKVAK